jgi:N-sulfoglucosamine sulfohydrolase
MYYPMRAVRERRYKLIRNLASSQEFPLAMDLKCSSTWQSVIHRGGHLYGQRHLQQFLHRPEYELYDLEADPDEVNNLVSDPKHEHVLRLLRERLLEFCKQTGDPWTLRI